MYRSAIETDPMPPRTPNEKKKESDPVDHTQLANNTAPLFLLFFKKILYKGLKNRKQTTKVGG
jgi:hypothetical protein